MLNHNFYIMLRCFGDMKVFCNQQHLLDPVAPMLCYLISKQIQQVFMPYCLISKQNQHFAQQKPFYNYNNATWYENTDQTRREIFFTTCAKQFHFYRLLV